MLFDYLIPIFYSALKELGLPSNDLVFEVPRQSDHGDAATVIAMSIGKQMKRNPRQVAEEIIANLSYDHALINSVTIAGPGFINVCFSQEYYRLLLLQMLSLGENIGKIDIGAGKSANVEFVSANPTGPLHPGHARNIMLGDAISNLLSATGYRVTREYYFNDAGNQMRNLALSVHARYRQLLGDKDYPFPTDGYHGEYIEQIAAKLQDEVADALFEPSEENLLVCKKKAEEWCFASIMQTLKRLGVNHDVFFNEHSLYTDGKIEQLLQILGEKKLSYESDGAVWIKTSDLGLEKDKVIVKSTGEPTYRLPDMAYHIIKCQRGDVLVVDIFGSDHVETIKEVLAGVQAVGVNTDCVKVVLHQMVTFIKDGKPFKLSKRSGEQYTLDDLIDELGSDVVRFFYLMRAAGAQLQFDMNLAKDQTVNNPVFYLQYAYARICSLLRTASENGVDIKESADLSALCHPREIALIKTLSQFSLVVQRAAQNFEPHTIVDFLREVATEFHSFYHDCRILGEEEATVQARLQLARATSRVLKNGFAILGISAPERM